MPTRRRERTARRRSASAGRAARWTRRWPARRELVRRGRPGPASSVRARPVPASSEAASPVRASSEAASSRPASSRPASSAGADHSADRLSARSGVQPGPDGAPGSPACLTRARPPGTRSRRMTCHCASVSPAAGAPATTMSQAAVRGRPVAKSIDAGSDRSPTANRAEAPPAAPPGWPKASDSFLVAAGDPPNSQNSTSRRTTAPAPWFPAPWFPAPWSPHRREGRRPRSAQARCPARTPRRGAAAAGRRPWSQRPAAAGSGHRGRRSKPGRRRARARRPRVRRPRIRRP